MKIVRILELSGPNIWTNRTALEAWVDLGSYEERPSNLIPGFYERLTGWLPSLVEHRCSEGERGGFLSRLRDGTWLGHILEHVSLELQTLAYEPVGYGRARETSQRGVYRVVIACLEPPLGRACLEAGVRLVLAAAEDQPFDLGGELQRLREVAHGCGLQTAPRLIAAAARARGIPAWRVPGTDLLLLGYGADQRRCRGTDLDRSPAVGAAIAADAELSAQLLRQVGIPVQAASERASARQEVLVVGTHVVGAFTDLGLDGPQRFLESIHPELASLSTLAARTLGLPVATIELAAQDLTMPLAEQSVAVVRAQASLDLAACARLGTSGQQVATALLNDWLPPGAPPRFQLVSVSGTNGKSEVAEHLHAMLAASGKRVGRIDAAEPDSSAQRALMNPLLDAVVLEVSELGVLEHGLPVHYCDVAVVTNLGSGDHLGRRYLQDLEFAKKAIRTPVDVVRPTGCAVLNADDPAVRSLAQHSKGQVLFFSACPPSAALWSELGAGARVVYCDAGRVHLGMVAGEHEDLGPVPPGRTQGTGLMNHLAAVATGYALGQAPEILAQSYGLTPSELQMCRNSSTVFISNCRNVSALDAYLAGSTATGASNSALWVLNVADDWTEGDAEAFGARATACAALALVAPSDHPAALQVCEWIRCAAAARGQPSVSIFPHWSDALDARWGEEHGAAALVQTLDRSASRDVAQWLERHRGYELFAPQGRSTKAVSVGHP
jgi:cyanophycin synthetase